MTTPTAVQPSQPICDWCGRAIPGLRTAKNNIVYQRVIFYGLGNENHADIKGDPLATQDTDVEVCIGCASGPYQAGAIPKKYILASPKDYPLLPDAIPMERMIKVRFTALQVSKAMNDAIWQGFKFIGNDGKIKPDLEKYFAWLGAKGRVEPGRAWAVSNDDRIRPGEKDKTAAIPLVLGDVDKRGDAVRALKRIIQGVQVAPVTPLKLVPQLPPKREDPPTPIEADEE